MVVLPDSLEQADRLPDLLLFLFHLRKEIMVTVIYIRFFHRGNSPGIEAGVNKGFIVFSRLSGFSRQRGVKDKTVGSDYRSQSAVIFLHDLFEFPGPVIFQWFVQQGIEQTL